MKLNQYKVFDSTVSFQWLLLVILHFFFPFYPYYVRLICLHSKHLVFIRIYSFIKEWKEIRKDLAEANNWRLRWKKSARFLTQNWTLSKTLQISHAVLFRCVKQYSVCFFCWSFLPFRNITYAKNLYLLSRQHVTPKTVISLKIQQNIDLSQRVSLKNVDFRLKPLKFWFHVNVRPQRR